MDKKMREQIEETAKMLVGSALAEVTKAASYDVFSKIEFIDNVGLATPDPSLPASVRHSFYFAANFYAQKLTAELMIQLEEEITRRKELDRNQCIHALLLELNEETELEEEVNRLSRPVLIKKVERLA